MYKINMVMHGANDWVFAKMIQEYRKHSSDNFEIKVSKHPIPNSDVYQYWRPMNVSGLRDMRKYPMHSDYYKRGIHMVHDSPYDPGRSKSNRKSEISKYHSALCTSMEQMNAYSESNVHYAPLGVFDDFRKVKEGVNTTDKIRIGWSGRIYGDKVKNEELLIQIARQLDVRKYSFVISSPNAQSQIATMRNLGFTVLHNANHMEMMDQMDVLLILSKFEGTPLPLIEGMSMGMHVLSRPVGEAPVLLEKDCICDTPKDFINALERIEKDRTILETSRERNPKKVENRTWENHVKSAENLWRSIICPKEEEENIEIVKVKDNTKHILFLSWHDSIPRSIKTLYDQLPFKKSFLSLGFLKEPTDPRLMMRSNSYKITDERKSIQFINESDFSHVVIWNGDFEHDNKGYQRQYIDKLNKKIVYAEHGWLPQSPNYSLDLEGSCGRSSITKMKNVPLLSNDEELTRLKRTYDKLAKDVKYSNYIYVPLQLKDDTQIKLYSPFIKSMDQLIIHLCRLFSDHKLVFKGHPKDRRRNLSRYQRLVLSQKQIWVEDLNNIGYCKHADRIISINSTVVNEALVFGKPIMTYGKNNFSDKGVTYEVKSYNELKHQKEFLNWTPDQNVIDNYLKFLLTRQHLVNNPIKDKSALEYFE